jgi:hypothetical protein
VVPLGHRLAGVMLVGRVGQERLNHERRIEFRHRTLWQRNR